MSKGYTMMLGTSVKPELLKRLDLMRGPIPRSKVLERALTQFMDDVETGKVSLLPDPPRIVDRLVAAKKLVLVPKLVFEIGQTFILRDDGSTAT